MGIMVSYAVPVVLNHCVLCCAGSVGIMVCYDDQVVGNHGVNAVPVGVIHGELRRASGCESLCAIMCQ